MKKFEFFEHTADILFKAYGKNVNEVFENAALAMFHTMSDNKIDAKLKKKFKVKGKDYESLLYNFLEEFLILIDTDDFFLSSVKVKIKDFTLEAEAVGDSVKNYETNIDVKAVTYNNMFVKKEKEKWVAQVVLDV
jgi:SHS2 domain-containing protein